MNQENFARLLKRKVDTRIAAVIEEVSRGSAKDFAEYKLAVGRLRGLGEVKDLIMETLKEMELAEDE